MKFSELDQKMRLYETAHDIVVLPGMYMVARLDGRSFSSVTEHLNYKKPYDPSFLEVMVTIVEYLMTEGGFNIVYGYTQSDEISLLFKHDTDIFGRKERKYNSVLASLAASLFTSCTLKNVAFDCRICQLPSITHVVDYFSWRQEDAHRNCLNSYCYWKLRQKEKLNGSQASKRLENVSNPDKHDLLMSYNINFNNIEAWRKRGTGFYFEEVNHKGINPLTKEAVTVKRKKLKADYELPFGDEYREFIRKLVL